MDLGSGGFPIRAPPMSGGGSSSRRRKPEMPVKVMRNVFISLNLGLHNKLR